MFEKNFKIGVLLDFYGKILPERKRLVIEMYYNEDFSLAEIAEQIGISRQGVRDLIIKAQDELLFFEETLGLSKRFSEAETHLETLSEMMKEISLPDKFVKEFDSLSDCIKS